MKLSSLLSSNKSSGNAGSLGGIATEEGRLTWDELFEPKPNHLFGKVLIVCSQPINSVKLMAYFDASVEDLLITPPNLNLDHLDNLIRDFNPDVVATDNDVNFLPEQARDRITFGVGAIATTLSTPEGPTATTWNLLSSGTTGTPKMVPHTVESLSQSVKTSDRVESRESRWGMLFDITRFAGLQVLFKAIKDDSWLYLPRDIRDIRASVTFLAENGVSHLSATPTQWRKILMTPASRNLDLKQVVIGGEPADQKLISTLISRFKNSTVTHTYASTESGLGFSASDGLSGYPLSYLRSRDEGRTFEIRNGRLWFRASDRSEVFSVSQVSNSDLWRDTGDLAQVVGERFFITGRASAVINVGGEKINPDEIRLRLIECDLISDAMVYGRPNPITGQVVCADIVLQPEARRDAIDEIEKFIRQNFANAGQPKKIYVVPELNSGATGKARRSTL